MNGARWRDRVGPPSILFLTALLITAVTPAAISATFAAAAAAVDCASLTPAVAGRAALSASRPGAARVAQQLNRRGELTGRTLSVGLAGGRSIAVALPVESSIAPQIGDLVIYTQHSTGIGSEVRAIDVASGCDVRLAAPREIVRSAIIDPSGSAIFVHSVMRAGRADAGVTRHDLATGHSELVVQPLQPSDELGPIFGTLLAWSEASDALAVQSCGFSRCLTRVLDSATGAVSVYDHAEQGAFIGLTSAHLVTFAACPGLPCAVLSTDLATGEVTVLADEGLSASIAADAKRFSVVIDSFAGRMEVAL